MTGTTITRGGTVVIAGTVIGTATVIRTIGVEAARRGTVIVTVIVIVLGTIGDTTIAGGRQFTIEGSLPTQAASRLAGA